MKLKLFGRTRTLCAGILFLCIVLQPCSGHFAVSGLSDNRNCFCELHGSINDCKCEIDTVDHFNNIKIYPRLQSLLGKKFFRYYKVNLKQKCAFWPADSKCGIRFCQVENCADETVPEGIKVQEGFSPRSPSITSYTKSSRKECSESEDFFKALGFLDTSISDQSRQDFQKWAAHDEAEEDFCILDDLQNGAQYVDLSINPERYTGYKSDAAHRIWSSIYLENCFGNPNLAKPFNHVPYMDLRDVCLEERAFYRLISGLHSSINIHLCSKYLLSETKGYFDTSGVWGPNVQEFRKRFSPETTDGEGPHWLRNLYFLYLLELRALAKAAPYLRRESFYTGFVEEDLENKEAINNLLTVIEAFPSHFDENALFSKGPASKFKSEYKQKFKNISRIMDCVGCEKCKLWGKLQTQGLGTALKILYSEKLNEATKSGFWDRSHMEEAPVFRLTRTEIVALFNSLGCISNSIYAIERFREIMK